MMVPDLEDHQRFSPADEHAPYILPCGHIFGRMCVETMFGANLNVMPTCPMCGQGSYHAGCGHWEIGVQLPNTKERMRNVPRLVCETNQSDETRKTDKHDQADQTEKTEKTTKNGKITDECMGCTLNDVLADLQKIADACSKDACQQMRVTCRDASTNEICACHPDHNEAVQGTPCAEPEGAASRITRFMEYCKKVNSGRYWAGWLLEVKFSFEMVDRQERKDTSREDAFAPYRGIYKNLYEGFQL